MTKLETIANAFSAMSHRPVGMREMTAILQIALQDKIPEEIADSTGWSITEARGILRVVGNKGFIARSDDGKYGLTKSGKNLLALALK